MSAPPAATIRKLPHYKRGRSPAETIEVYSMPVPECGCWIWLGAANRYGMVRGDRAHRVSWKTFRGPIPHGLHVLHKCDTPLCVNPDHLFLGTHLDNMKDKEEKGRGNQPSGERSGRHTKPWRTARGDNHYARRHPETKQGERNPRLFLRPNKWPKLDSRPWGIRNSEDSMV
jgi:hypothetical protein